MTKTSIESPIWRSLIAGVFIAPIAAALIFIPWEIGESSQISQALTVIPGMTAIATLSAFNQFRQDSLEAELSLEKEKAESDLSRNIYRRGDETKCPTSILFEMQDLFWS